MMKIFSLVWAEVMTVLAIVMMMSAVLANQVVVNESYIKVKNPVVEDSAKPSHVVDGFKGWQLAGDFKEVGQYAFRLLGPNGEAFLVTNMNDVLSKLSIIRPGSLRYKFDFEIPHGYVQQLWNHGQRYKIELFPTNEINKK